MLFFKIGYKQASIYVIAALLIFVAPIFVSFNPVVGQSLVITQKTLKNEAVKTPKFIYFWAKWCPACKKMQPPISEVLKDYRGLTIAVRSGANSKVDDYLIKHHLNWNTVNDEDSIIAKKYAVKAVPTIFILNSQGKIAFEARGYTSEFELRLRLWLAS